MDFVLFVSYTTELRPSSKDGVDISGIEVSETEEIPITLFNLF